MNLICLKHGNNREYNFESCFATWYGRANFINVARHFRLGKKNDKSNYNSMYVSRFNESAK